MVEKKPVRDGVNSGTLGIRSWWPCAVSFRFIDKNSWINAVAANKRLDTVDSYGQAGAGVLIFADQEPYPQRYADLAENVTTINGQKKPNISPKGSTAARGLFINTSYRFVRPTVHHTYDVRAENKPLPVGFALEQTIVEAR